MAELSQAPVYTARSTLNHRYLKHGQHTSVVPMDPEISRLIGTVVTYWAAFEANFDSLLGALIAESKNPVPDWERLSFRKRKELFVQVTKTAYGADYPEAVKGFAVCAGMAADAHWRRNVIMHGHYSFSRPLDSRSLVFTARGTHNGRDVSITLDHDNLIKLTHDIGHVMGKMFVTTRMVAAIKSDIPTFADSDLLRVRGENSPLPSPIPDTL